MKLAIATSCLVALGGTASALGGYETATPYAYGGDLNYHATGAPTRYYTDGGSFQGGSFFDVFYDITFASAPHMPPPPGGASTGQGNGSSLSQVSLNGLPPGTRYIGNFAMSFFDVFVEFSSDGATRFFDTEILSMELAMATPYGLMMVRESPTLISPGHYSVKDLGNGMYHVDSFFDIFTELSMDGGQTWTPAEGSTRFELVPGPGALALLGAWGLGTKGRRRRS
jgi:hypothetical protein